MRFHCSRFYRLGFSIKKQIYYNDMLLSQCIIYVVVFILLLYFYFEHSII